MANLARTDGIQAPDRLSSDWKQTPGYGSPGGTLGGPTPVLFFAPPRELEDGSGVYASFKPGFAGKIIAVLAKIKEDGAGAGASVTLNPRINQVDITGGVVTITLATAVSGQVIGGTTVTGANTFDANDAIEIEEVEGTAFTDGEAEVYLLVEPK